MKQTNILRYSLKPYRLVRNQYHQEHHFCEMKIPSHQMVLVNELYIYIYNHYCTHVIKRNGGGFGESINQYYIYTHIYM